MSKLSKIDMASIFHPCSQMSEYAQRPPIVVSHARGAYYFDENNKSYFDGISSWWVNTLGHAEPRIASAISAQSQKLAHGILAGFSNEPIIRLSERLLALAPKNLKKCFYGDSGSSAVEIALKLAWHYCAINGGKRDKFLCLSGGYHGETLGALGVSDVGVYKAVFEPLLAKPLVALAPNASQNISEAKAKKSLEQILAQKGDEIVAFIAEPLLQCAGGMNVYPASFLEFAVKECRKRGILVIFDEIATGWGRTGKLFATQHLASECAPDMMCLSKGLTAGFLPLSVVLLSDEIYNAFYAPYGTGRDFLHSHSYAGNTLACTAANAMLDIFKADDVLAKNEALSDTLKSEWARLGALKAVKNCRVFGMVAAFELELNSLAYWANNAASVQNYTASFAGGLKADELNALAAGAGLNSSGLNDLDVKNLSNASKSKKTLGSNPQSPAKQRFSIDFFWRCIEKGLFLRPLGNTIYFMPPYCVKKSEIKWVVDVIIKVIDEYKKPL